MMITVRVQPNAKHDAVVGFLADGSLKVRVAAPPVNERANERVRELLAKSGDVKKQDVVIQSGFARRIKRIELPMHAFTKLHAQFSHVQELDLFPRGTTDGNA